jgi:hypothetical protein
MMSARTLAVDVAKAEVAELLSGPDAGMARWCRAGSTLTGGLSAKPAVASGNGCCTVSQGGTQRFWADDLRVRIELPQRPFCVT